MTKKEIHDEHPLRPTDVGTKRHHRGTKDLSHKIQKKLEDQVDQLNQEIRQFGQLQTQKRDS
jgi:hypothetical protein